MAHRPNILKLATKISLESLTYTGIGYNDPEYDAAYLKATSTTDDAEQTAAFKECERILTEQAANVYIQDVASFVVMQNNVDGYEYYPLYVMDLSKIYFTE